MTNQDAPPQIHLDLNAPAFNADPYPTLARIREGAPVYYWPEAHAYVVSRFADVSQVLRDPRLSTDAAAAGQPRAWSGLPDGLKAIFEHGPMSLGPKDHARVRRAVSPAFTPSAIERMRPDIQRIVDAALAPFEGADEIDVVKFAERIPLRAIAHMLRIPAEHEEMFRRYAEAYIRFVDPQLSREEFAQVVAPIGPGTQLIRELIAERRKNLGDDLLSTLIRAEEAGDRLSEEEMVSLVASMIVGGSETTRYFICFAVKSLLCVPERMAAVRADPTVLRSALEETLRFDNFGKSGTQRYAVEDVEIGGTRIPRGSMIVVLLSAALRDPRAFPDADRFDARREPAENLSFGVGMHYCLGAALARLEGEVVIRTLLDRYEDMRLAAEPEISGHPMIRKLSSLRVAVTPRAQRANAGT